MSWKKSLVKVWHFIWEDNSIWSWIVNFVLAFILIKFIVYPSLGYLLQTTHPVVAVVSESMEHRGNFNDWWNRAGKWYEQNNIQREDYSKFSLKNGFNKGDIMVLKGTKPEKIQAGDVIVFWSFKRDPIIHRVVKKWKEDGINYFQTKGDNNPGSINSPSREPFIDETRIRQDQILGNAVVRIPFLGYIKIWFVQWFLEPLRVLISNIPQKG